MINDNLVTLIIEAKMTDSQIAIVANKLGYLKRIQTGKNIQIIEDTDIQAKNQVGEDVFDEEGKPVFIKNIRVEPEEIDNPMEDDEFVRQHFVKMITNIVTPIFLEEQLKEIRLQEQAIGELMWAKVWEGISTRKE